MLATAMRMAKKQCRSLFDPAQHRDLCILMAAMLGRSACPGAPLQQYKLNKSLYHRLRVRGGDAARCIATQCSSREDTVLSTPSAESNARFDDLQAQEMPWKQPHPEFVERLRGVSYLHVPFFATTLGVSAAPPNIISTKTVVFCCCAVD